MLASITHILPLTTIRRDRFLPVTGKVVVRKGQKLAATDTVAEANLHPAHLLMDMARGLGMSAERADEYLQVKTGDTVAEGDILAGPVGITRRVVRSPRNGRVVLAGSGQVLLEVQSKPFELKAGMPGIVVELVEGRGAILETTGALIQGAWGNGGIDFGLMTVLAKEPEHELTPDQMDVSMRGAVILGGYVANDEVLRTAAELPLRGLILSSMDPSLVPAAQRISVPVVLLEGLGKRPLNPMVFKLLSTSDRREVSVNAEPWDRYAGTRPEIVIPLPAPGQLPLPPDVITFQEGQQVRIVSAPHPGILGTLVELRGVTALPNGVRAPAGDVRLEDGSTVLLPLANLEVLQ